MTAINPLRGEATLVDGARTLVLVFDVNAFCLAEPVLGMTTDAMLEAVDAMNAADRAGKPGGVAMPLLRGLLWAGLQMRHPEFHLIAAGELLGRVRIGAARGAIMAGLAAAFGVAIVEAEEGDGENPPEGAEDGTG